MARIDLPSYTRLLKLLSQTLAEGKVRAQQAVERERVSTYHTVGGLIDRHLLQHGAIPGYGDRLFDSLADDLGIAVNLLRDGHLLYRWHPNFHARGELGWTHYRILLRLPDYADRNRLEAEAAKNRWPTRELEKRIRQSLPPQPPSAIPGSPTVLEPLRGLIDSARGLDLPPAGRVLDLGFTTYARPSDLKLSTFPKGDLIVSETRQRYTLRRTRSRKARYFSYLGQVERVIDGDTLLLQIQPLFGAFLRERVRLRGITGNPGR